MGRMQTWSTAVGLRVGHVALPAMRAGLVAVIVALGGALMAHAPRSAASTVVPMAHIIGHDGGLDVALDLPAGPYFLGEYLPITLTLRNATARPLTVVRLMPWQWVAEEGGVAPRVTPPINYEAMSYPPPMPQAIAPGGHLSVPTSLILVSSGAAVIRVRALRPLMRAGAYTGDADDHPVRVPIAVAPSAPLGRTLRLGASGLYVYVHAGSGPLPPLKAVSELAYATSWGLGEWPIGGGHFRAPTGMIAGHKARWTVEVESAGYRVAWATYTRIPLQLT